jgi:putative transposase
MRLQDVHSFLPARQIIGRWVEFYNTRRLHAGLKYLAPAEYWVGDPETRFEERNEKLKQARERGEIINRKRLQEAA